MSRSIVLLSFSSGSFDKDDDDIQRHLAAIQIQEIFRKRRAVKEGKRATRLPRPFVQRVFSGHRNSRTMVIWFFLSRLDCPQREVTDIVPVTLNFTHS